MIFFCLVYHKLEKIVKFIKLLLDWSLLRKIYFQFGLLLKSCKKHFRLKYIFTCFISFLFIQYFGSVGYFLHTYLVPEIPPLWRGFPKIILYFVIWFFIFDRWVAITVIFFIKYQCSDNYKSIIHWKHSTYLYQMYNDNTTNGG